MKQLTRKPTVSISLLVLMWITGMISFCPKVVLAEEALRPPLALPIFTPEPPPAEPFTPPPAPTHATDATTAPNRYNALTSEAAPSVRIKDVADVLGVRENQLIGQGLVVGLGGTGDSSGTLTAVALANIVARLGINVPATTLKPKNVALVAITATLPAYIKKGQKIDVQISSLGDATSLQGGILLQSPLQGADGKVYAVTQGAVSVGGFSLDGKGGKNHVHVGRIPNGALIEREVETQIEKNGLVRISLRRGDFTSAQRMAEAINKKWKDSTRALDPFTVEFLVPKKNEPESLDTVAIVAELELLKFQPDAPALVIVNERTGTIVAGANVKLSPTVLSHGNLFISISEASHYASTASLTTGVLETSKTKEKNVKGVEASAQVLVLEHGPTLGDLAAALNALKFTPRDIIAIFQALKEAGALNAELRIM